MADETIIPLDEATRAEIGRELEIARTKYGDQHFELLCIEGSWGETLDDRDVLRLLRSLNRAGSMYSEIIFRV
jgi:hypothetical protein